MPDPAEHCRSINAGVGDRIKPPVGPERTITYIGHNYIHVSYVGDAGDKGDARPETWDRYEDISAWSKVPPPPRFEIIGHARTPGLTPSHVYMVYTIRTRPADVDELYRRVSGAITDADENKGEASEGPYRAVENSTHHFDVKHGNQSIFGIYANAEADARLGADTAFRMMGDAADRFASELNALHAKTLASGTVAG